MKVLFTKDYGKEKFDKISELGYEIMYYNENIVTNNEDVDSADILVTYNPFRTLDINKMENLKYIQTTSIGIDQIPVDKILNRDIVIANNKGGYSIPIGEWIVMSILEIYKNSKKFHEQQINKKWKMNFSITELSGKKIGFIGTGTLATESSFIISNLSLFIIPKVSFVAGIVTTTTSQFLNTSSILSLAKHLSKYSLL